MKTLNKIYCSLIILFLFSGMNGQVVRPAGGTPKNFVLPEVKTLTLDNGLAVTLIPYGDLPKVTVRLIVRAGNLNEAKDELNLADLMGSMMKEGTSNLSGQQIAEKSAAMGGTVDVGVGVETTSVSGDVLSEFGPELVKLIADIVMNPSFPTSEIDRLKNDMKRNLSIQKSQPGSLAFELFRKVLYPDHPFGRVFPEDKEIDTFTIEKVKGFYDNNFGAARSHIYVAGKFDEAAVEKSITEAFKSWKKGPEILINIPKPSKTNMVYIIDRPGAPQSVLNIGLPVINPSDKDFMALSVTNDLLGGAYISRITMNIRENKGYTYSPYSEVSVRYHDAYWMQYAEVGTETTAPALKEIFFEINRLKNEPIPADELSGIKNYIAGIFVLRNSSRGGIISQLAYLDLHGLDKSFLTNYVSNVQAVTQDDIQRVMKTYLNPEEMTIVIAGDKAKIEKGVGTFAPVFKEK
jgi:zinc protease